MSTTVIDQMSAEITGARREVESENGRLNAERQLKRAAVVLTSPNCNEIEKTAALEDLEHWALMYATARGRDIRVAAPSIAVADLTARLLDAKPLVTGLVDRLDELPTDDERCELLAAIHERLSDLDTDLHVLRLRTARAMAEFPSITLGDMRSHHLERIRRRTTLPELIHRAKSA